MKIAFCSSEVVPFAKTGGMADVCGSLPLYLEKLGQDVVIVLPGYGCIDRRKYGFTQIRDQVSQTIIGKNIPVYLIESERYFSRWGVYGDKSGDYPDNCERFDYYCRRTLELFKDLKFSADIVHCHDWQSALISVYLKNKLFKDEFYKAMKTVLSFHNLAYQGIFPAEQYKKLHFGEKVYADAFEYYGRMNLLKAGLVYSDVIATVSPQYAREIKTPEFGCGLEGVLRSRGESMIGILNGIDCIYWDPRRDRNIEFNYSANSLEDKAKNKAALQKITCLPVKPRVPVFGFVGRLAHQKGLDLLNKAMAQLMTLDIQMVFLGVGEEKYQQMLSLWAKQYPNKIAVDLNFDEEFSHAIYAGADLFLMPSIYEPCGLSQMISMRYATVPVVYRVGGLMDTVIAHDQGGNGFVFTEYTPHAFFNTIAEVVKVYREPKVFDLIVRETLKANFSWETSALQYVGLYNQCLKNQ
jgi:starch synthase